MKSWKHSTCKKDLEYQTVNIALRIPQQDVKEIDNMLAYLHLHSDQHVPKNRSEFTRCAIKKLLEEYKKNAAIF